MSLITSEKDNFAVSILRAAEELLAIPDDGLDRILVLGKLRERPLTARGRPHCLVSNNLSWLITKWLRPQPRPRGAP